MDLFIGIGTFVADIMDIEGEIKKLLQKLELVIIKAEKLFISIHWNQQEDQAQKRFYQNCIKSARQYYTEIENKAKALGIKHKISMNLPFDKTKNNLKTQIQQLQKIIDQLKDVQNIGIQKRKISTPLELIKSRQLIQTRFQPPPTLIQDDMGPTIQDKQDDRRGTWIRVTLKLQVQQKINQQFKQKQINEQNYDIERTFEMNNTEQEVVDYFNRQKFKINYEKIKKIIPEIDFISSKDKHFQIICRKYQIQKNLNQVQEILLSVVNGPQKQLSKSYENEPQVFFSFPYHSEQNKESSNEYKLFCKNHSKAGTFFLRPDQHKWQKFTQTIQIHTGYKLSPMLRKPDRIFPIFTYAVNFEILKFQ